MVFLHPLDQFGIRRHLCAPGERAIGDFLAEGVREQFGGDADRADQWMRSNLPALGGRHPEHACSEAGGMEPRGPGEG